MPLRRSVVEVHMRELDAPEALVAHDRATPARAQKRRSASCSVKPPDNSGNESAQAGEHQPETVVLRGDLDATRAQVHNGLVTTAMTELQLFDLGSARLRYHLMPQADAEYRHRPSSFDLGVRSLDRLGIPPVREEHTVGIEREDIFRRGVSQGRR